MAREHSRGYAGASPGWDGAELGESYVVGEPAGHA